VKAIVVVHSCHHGNTEKVARAIARILGAPVKTPRETRPEELGGYDLVGFGSGIDSDRHYQPLLHFAESLPRVAGKKSFIFSTCGIPAFAFGKKYIADYAAKSHAALRTALSSKGYDIVGEFTCPGHNSNSFLRLFGGLNRGRPNARDLADAEEFAGRIGGGR
jgi:flavodoxin